MSNPQSQPQIDTIVELKTHSLTPNLMFSEREQQVVHLLISGYTLRGISINLELSMDGVRFHVRNIYTKLGVSTRCMLVIAVIATRSMPFEEIEGYYLRNKSPTFLPY